MRFNSVLCAVVFSFSLTACDSEAADPTLKEQVEQAANGDKEAMRDLEKMVAEKAKAEKKALDDLGDLQKQDKQFYWDLAAGKIGDDALRKLAGDDENIHAQVYTARIAGKRDGLADADRKLFIRWLEHISTVDKAHTYHALNGGKYPLAGEAAFVISEDYLNARWLYPSDMTEAVKWLNKAADLGQPEAMFKLATRYQYGLDMVKDMKAAQTWMQKSADAGWRSAKDALKDWAE